jgi:hypothetical protein
MQGEARPQRSLPFPLAFLPESKTGYFQRQVFWLVQLLRLPSGI